MKKSFLLILVISVVLSSCVSKKKYTELEGNFNSKNQELLGRMMVLSDSAHSFGATYNNKKDIKKTI